MILQLLTLLAVNSETSLPQVSAVSSQPFTFGILWRWAQSHNSPLVQQPRVAPLFQLVHVRDMLQPLIKVMIITCTSTTCKERRCSSLSLLVQMPSSRFNGLKNLMILNSLLSPLDQFNSGTQLMPARSSLRTVPSGLNLPRPSSLALLSMKMVFATLVVLTVVSIFGIKNKI